MGKPLTKHQQNALEFITANPDLCMTPGQFGLFHCNAATITSLFSRGLLEQISISGDPYERSAYRLARGVESESESILVLETIVHLIELSGVAPDTESSVGFADAAIDMTKQYLLKLRDKKPIDLSETTRRILRDMVSLQEMVGQSLQ